MTGFGKLFRRSNQSLLDQLDRHGRLTSFQKQVADRGEADKLFVGDYLLESELGSPSYGSLYKAVHLPSQSYVAIRAFDPGLVLDAQGYHAIVEDLFGFDHPNVVSPVDAFDRMNQLFVVRPYETGESLTALVKRAGPVGIERAVGCVLEVCKLLNDDALRAMRPLALTSSQLIIGIDGIFRVTGLDETRVLVFRRGRRTRHGKQALVSKRQRIFWAPELAKGPVREWEPSLVYSLGRLYRHLAPEAFTTQEHRTASSVASTENGIAGTAARQVQDSIRKACLEEPKDRWSSVRAFENSLGEAFAADRSSYRWIPSNHHLAAERAEDFPRLRLLDLKRTVVAALLTLSVAACLIIPIFASRFFDSGEEPGEFSSHGSGRGAQPEVIRAEEEFRIP